MARAHYFNFVSDAGGAPLSGATVTVYEPGTTTPLAATMYAAITGGTTQANPITAASDGSFHIYIETGQYVNLLIQAAGQADKTIPYVNVTEDQANLVKLTGAQSVTGVKTMTSPILNNPTLASPVLSGQLLLPTAAISVPSIAQNANPDTGITFDAADEIAFAVAGVEVARITAAGLIANLIETSGPMFEVDGYGSDPTGSAESSTAFDLAMTAATASKGTVKFGTGAYKLNKKHTIPAGVTVAGMGKGATTLKRAFNTNDVLLSTNNGAKITIRSLTYDGDYTNNITVANPDIDLRGTDNVLYDCEVRYCRNWGATLDGTRTSILRCDFVGPNIGALTSNGTVNTNGVMLAGITGFYGSSRGGLVWGCTFQDMAEPGCFPAGSDIKIIDNTFDNCHVHDIVTGGGQCAINTAPLVDASVQPRNILIAHNVIRTTTGNSTVGIEANKIDGITIIGNLIEGQGAHGIQLDDCVRAGVIGNISRNNDQGATVSNSAGIYVTAGLTRSQTGILIQGNHCYDDQGSPTQDWGIYVAADNGSYASDYLTIIGNNCRNNINAAGISLNGTGLNKHCHTNWPSTAPSQLIGGLGLSGGVMSVTSTTSNAAILNPFVSAGILPVMTIQRSGSAKYHVGLNASDHFAILNAAGSAAAVTVDPATAITTLLSQGASTTTALKVGRTAVDGQFGAAGATNAILTGTAAGDTAVSADTGDLVMGTVAAKSIEFVTNNGAAARIDEVKNIMLGTGGGAKAIGDTAGYVWIPYSLGKPTGNPGSPTGSNGLLPLQFDGTNNKLVIWNGAAWISSGVFA